MYIYIALDEVCRCIHTCRSSQESDPLYICCEKIVTTMAYRQERIIFPELYMRIRKSVGCIFVLRKLYLWHIIIGWFMNNIDLRPLQQTNYTHVDVNTSSDQ